MDRDNRLRPSQDHQASDRAYGPKFPRRVQPRGNRGHKIQSVNTSARNWYSCPLGLLVLMDLDESSRRLPATASWVPMGAFLDPN